MGTFNYAGNYKVKLVEHFNLDVSPWYYYGTSLKDTTTIYDRHFLYTLAREKMEFRNKRGK